MDKILLLILSSDNNGFKNDFLKKLFLDTNIEKIIYIIQNKNTYLINLLKEFNFNNKIVFIIDNFSLSSGGTLLNCINLLELYKSYKSLILFSENINFNTTLIINETNFYDFKKNFYLLENKIIIDNIKKIKQKKFTIKYFVEYLLKKNVKIKSFS
tara:strand:- start:1686 stop:2153 length:468 start_codon:yes stop_codon:yes gene_type:complete